MTVTIRSATPADAGVIAEYNHRLALETENKVLDPPVLAAGVARVLGDPSRGLYFVAEAGGDVVGQLMVTFEWSDWRNGWVWWLQSVYVRADRRGRGVFRRLFEFALAKAKAAGDVVSVRLYVEKENAPAIATYERLGFENMHFNLMHLPLNGVRSGD
ncbi:MAG: GNAT family N-acetyltransferase [Gemmataceae bacterium]